MPQAVYGLAFDTYECQINNSNIEKTLIIAVTNDSMYQFIGDLPFEQIFSKYSSENKLNKHNIGKGCI